MSEELNEACEDNDKGNVLQLLRSQAVVDRINGKINNKMGKPVTALWSASVSASAAVVRALMRKGADVNVWSHFGTELPIHAACGSDIDAVKKCELFLGETNTNINEPRGSLWANRLPISIAAEYDNIEVVDLLLRRGADYDIHGDDRGPGPLQAAAEEGHVNIIKLLLNHDPRIINIQSRFHGTVGIALHAAVYCREVAAVKALVAHPDCDVTFTDSEGKTPLDIAQENDENEIITLLTEAAIKRKNEQYTNQSTASKSSAPKLSERERKTKPSRDKDSCTKARQLEHEKTTMRRELGNISLKSDKQNDAISQKLREMDKRFDVLENKLHSTDLKVKDLHQIKKEQRRISDEIRKLKEYSAPVTRRKGASNELSDLTLDKIAVKVGIGDQMSLGLHLGFEYEEVERTIAKYASQKDATLNLLIRWRNQESSGNKKKQVQQLETIFRELNKMNLVRFLNDLNK